jgi:hypothetical protein
MVGDGCLVVERALAHEYALVLMDIHLRGRVTAVGRQLEVLFTTPSSRPGLIKTGRL